MTPATFYILNTKEPLVIPNAFNGCAFIYKKSEMANVANVQIELFDRLIEKGLKKMVEDFLFVDINNTKERYATLKKQAPIKQYILFGVKESEIGINFDIPLHQIVEIENVFFLKTVSPEVLEKDNSMKAAFWTQLQTVLK